MALTQVNSEGIKDGEVKNADMADNAVGIDELSATGTASNTTFLRGDNSWVTPTDTNTQLSTEEVQDIVGGMFTGNTETNITATYEDSDGTIDLVVGATGAALTGSTNNTICTVTGANAIQGEANLTFDGDTLSVTGANGDLLKLNSAGSETYLYTDNNEFSVKIDPDDDEGSSILTVDIDGSEKLRINSSGQVGVGCTDQLSDYASDRTKLSIQHTGNSGGYLELGGDQTAAGYSAGTVLFCNTNNSSSVRDIAMMRAEIVTSDNNAGDDSGGDIVFYNRAEGGGPLANLKVRSDRNCELVDGNLIFADGHGIDFYNYGSGSNIDSNLLNDYEEGTFSPGMHRSSSGTSSMAYNYQYGRYTKIGDFVYVQFDLDISSWSGGGGSFRVSGLPFPPSVSSGGAGYGAPQFRASSFLGSDFNTSQHSSWVSDTAGGCIYPMYFNSSGGDVYVSSPESSGRVTGYATYFTNS